MVFGIGTMGLIGAIKWHFLDMGYGGGGVVWWFFAHSGLAKWTYMHPKCAGMEKIRANDHNIHYIALKVTNLRWGDIRILWVWCVGDVRMCMCMWWVMGGCCGACWVHFGSCVGVCGQVCVCVSCCQCVHTQPSSKSGSSSRSKVSTFGCKFQRQWGPLIPGELCLVEVKGLVRKW